jgi:hypothetical protein
MNALKWVTIFAIAGAIAAATPVAAVAQGFDSISLLNLLPLAVGVTTGTKSAGSDFIGMSELMKTVYGKSFENNIEKETEVLGHIRAAEGFEVIDGPDGKGVNISHTFSSGGGVGSMLEDDYLYTPTVPTAKQGTITIKQHTATVELSGRTLRRVKKGPAAFVNWANEALPRKASRLAFHKDRMAVGAGTGILFRINEASPDGTDDGVDSAYGIAGLEGALNLILRDDNTRWSPNADGSSPRTGTARFVSGNRANQTATFSALPSGGVDNDFVFLGDANVYGYGAREMMGLEGLIDDGNVLATLQTLARSSYPELQSQVIDASTGGWNGVLSEELLDYADSQCYEVAMGMPRIVLVNRSGQRSFWKSLKGDRVLNDPKGVYKGGKAKLQMMMGGRVVDVDAARKIPSSRAYGLDDRTIMRYKTGTGRWDDTDGSVWNRTVDGTGRKDAFFAIYIEEDEMGIGDPAQSFKIKNLTAA